MTMDEIMDDLDHDDILSTKITGHNEVTITYKDGVKICRLRETNIVNLHSDGKTFGLNTGGWATKTTKTHMVDFLNRNLPPEIKVGVFKEGGLHLRVHHDGGSTAGYFDQWIVAIHTDSGYTISSDKSK